LRACRKAKVEPVCRKLGREYDEEQIVRFIVDENVNRRHLSQIQRGLITVQHIQPAFERIAKEKQREHGKTAPGKGKTLVTELSQVNGRAPHARQQAAAIMSVSEGTLAVAKRIAQAPDLAAKVMSGEIQTGAAANQVKARQAEAPPLPKEAP